MYDVCKRCSRIKAFDHPCRNCARQDAALVRIQINVQLREAFIASGAAQREPFSLN